MSDGFDQNNKAIGLYRHPNNLDSPDGSLMAADECAITRENQIDRRKGYSLCNTGLPAATPQQMFVGDNTLFTHIDNSIYYEDPGTCNFTKIPSGGVGNIIYPRSLELSGTIMYLLERVISTDTYNVRAINLINNYVYTIKAGLNIPFMKSFSIDGNFMYYCKFDYLASPNTVTLRKINLTTAVDTFIAGGNIGHANGIGAAAQFNDISGITFDANNIYTMSETAVRKIDKATSNVITPLGSGVPGFTDGVGAAAQLICYGLSATYNTSTGAFVAFRTIQRTTMGPTSRLHVRTIDPLTWTITTNDITKYFTVIVNGAINSDLAHDDVTLRAYSVMPTVYSVVGWGDELFGDAEVVVLAGPNANFSGYVDAVGADARFDFDGLETTETDLIYQGQSSRPVSYGGFLYVPDYNNQVIRKIDCQTGSVVTYLGNNQSPSSTDGVFGVSSIMGPE